MSAIYQRLLNAQKMRQAALDYINANPGALGPDIIAAMEWKVNAGSSRLEHMTCNLSELSRVPAISLRKNAIGVFHHQRTYRYTALVLVTRSAKTVLDYIQEQGRTVGNAPKTMSESNQKKAGVWTARGFRNTREDRPCKPSCGAQGVRQNRPVNQSAWGL